jgi:hypothetical protein
MVLNMHAPSEEKSDDSKDSFYEEIGQDFYNFPKHNKIILLGHIWPLSKVVHGDQKVSVSPVAFREETCDVNRDSLEVCTDVLLMHQNPTPGPGTLTVGTGDAMTPSLYDVSQPQPIVA